MTFHKFKVLKLEVTKTIDLDKINIFNIFKLDYLLFLYFFKKIIIDLFHQHKHYFIKLK